MEDTLSGIKTFQKEYADALVYYQQIADRHPESDYFDEAEAKISSLTQLLAEAQEEELIP